MKKQAKGPKFRTGEIVLEDGYYKILAGTATKLAQPDPASGETERIWCMNCGKSVSSPVPKGTVVRAYVECPECIEKRGAVGPPPGKYA